MSLSYLGSPKEDPETRFGAGSLLGWDPRKHSEGVGKSKRTGRKMKKGVFMSGYCYEQLGGIPPECSSELSHREVRNLGCLLIAHCCKSLLG